jgi:hypothetical protein
VPDGAGIVRFLRVEDVGSPKVAVNATFHLEIPSSQLADPAHVVLLHAHDGAWDAVDRFTLVKQGDSWKGTATSPCCSWFAVATDSLNPTIALDAPSGNVTGVVTITARAADNIGVTSVELFLDGVSVGVDALAPYSFPMDTARYSDGSHNWSAVASDRSGHTAAAWRAATFTNQAEHVQPVPTPAGKEQSTNAGQPKSALGASGIVLFVVFGLLLAVGTGVLLVRNRRLRAASAAVVTPIPEAAPGSAVEAVAETPVPEPTHWIIDAQPEPSAAPVGETAPAVEAGRSPKSLKRAPKKLVKRAPAKSTKKAAPRRSATAKKPSKGASKARRSK